MYAEELLSTLMQKKIIGQLPKVIKDIAIDSRSVQPSSLFICLKGYTVDGHNYAQKAVDAGMSVKKNIILAMTISGVFADS